MSNYIITVLIVLGIFLSKGEKEFKNYFKKEPKAVVLCLAAAPLCLGMALGLEIQKNDK